jgi:uncharacterized membrane protein YfcA
MPALIIIAVVGLAAQLIDGGLGMGYGVISTSLLLITGLTPAAASASVHLAEIGTTLVSGISHWRFGNIDWPVVLRIALPGAIGAFTGATLLSSLPADSAAPWTSTILIILGTVLIIRFTTHHHHDRRTTQRPRTRFLAPLGLIAGTVDATGGGGWGPIATSTMLASGKLDPRKAIGSVSAAEFAVAIAASIGFLIGLSHAGVVWPVVIALLTGGVIAAPLAAWLVRKLPTWLLGVSVGGIIIATNARTILNALNADTTAYTAVFAVLLTGWTTALAIAIRHRQRTRIRNLEPAPEPV